jgi:hypothetical protein
MKRLSEIGVLTRDTSAAAEAWTNASGLEVRLQGTEGLIDIGDVLIRLIGPDSASHVAGLVERRGEGMFDLAIEIDDFLQTIQGLRDKGVPVSDPMIDANGRQVAMIDPASSHGVPIRLVEKK